MIGHWILAETDSNPNDFFGMVYLITCLETNRKYVGKKQFRSRRRKKVIGRKNRKVCIKESDWKDYTGSCVELNEDIQRLGKEKFKFEILKWCKTKRDMGYTEVREQFARDVLNSKLPNGDREYYNANIMSRWFVAPREHTQKTKEKIGRASLGRVFSEEHRNKISQAHIGMKKPWVAIRNRSAIGRAASKIKSTTINYFGNKNAQKKK